MYAQSKVLEKVTASLVALTMVLAMTVFAISAKAVDEVEVLETTTTGEEATTGEDTTTEAEDTESSMTLWYIVGGVVVVALLGMFMMKRK